MRLFFYFLPIGITSLFVFTASTNYIWLATLAFVLVGLFRNIIGKFEKDEIIDVYNFFHFSKKMKWVKIISGFFFVAFNFWTLYFLSNNELSVLQFVIFVYSYIAINSAFAISLAHDLMHSSLVIGRIFSAVLLIQNGFFYLISDHLYTHHQFAASLQDPATALKGESVYRYFYRSIIGRFNITFFSGSTFPLSRRKSIIRKNVFYLICCISYLSFSIFLDVQVFLCVLFGYFFVTLIYESVTYIQHYGLTRKKTEQGTLSSMELEHAWNCFYKTSAYMHFMMPIHSIHHLNKVSNDFDGFYGLEMPKSFSEMLFTAWFPRSWFKLMDGIQKKA